ncbi:hypothetical protein PG994_000950 [Apiospora phragmitis]|uniref:Uncharacterized protein n=1 Tax=Apiospora phragmitis TaxID=2905665 RepID=A0ABR1WR07_9PEZI
MFSYTQKSDKYDHGPRGPGNRIPATKGIRPPNRGCARCATRKSVAKIAPTEFAMPPLVLQNDNADEAPEGETHPFAIGAFAMGTREPRFGA